MRTGGFAATRLALLVSISRTPRLSAMPSGPPTALQRYGMYLGDTGGGINLYAVHPQSYPSHPYIGLLPDEPYPPLPNIPIDRFRVIELGPVTPPWVLRSRARLVPTQCATMRW
jgi:hypothetical protein